MVGGTTKKGSTKKVSVLRGKGKWTEPGVGPLISIAFFHNTSIRLAMPARHFAGRYFRRSMVKALSVGVSVALMNSPNLNFSVAFVSSVRSTRISPRSPRNT